MDDPKDSEKLRGEHGVEFPLLSDAKLETIRAFGLEHGGKDMSIPATYVIDKKGVVRYRYLGESVPDRPALNDVISAL